MPQKIILVRHGETDYNQQKRMQGWLDIPLNARGHEQARVTAERFVDIHVDALYSSDLVRAHTTAQYIASTLKSPVITTKALRERDMGIFSGWQWEVDTDPKKHALWQEFEYARDHEDFNWNKHRGESLRQMTERLTVLLEHLHAQHHNQTVVLVTHGGTINRLLEHFKLKDAKLGFQEVKNASLQILHKQATNYQLEVI